jgi:gliding motility-associated-like protein
VAEGSLTITASGGAQPYQYSIDNGSTWQSASSFTDLPAGSYFIWVQDDNGCMVEFDLNPVNLVAGSGVVISSIYGANDCMIEIDAVGDATPFEYSFDGGVTYTTTNVFSTDSLCEILGDTIAESNVFEVVVRDDNGCTDTEIIEIRGCTSRCNPLEIWKAITPNGDGYNDEWDLEGYRNKYPDMVVRIYNTWGNLVFESARGYPEPWDGTKDGTALPAGTYFYVIDRGDGSDAVSGTVNIVK